LVVIGGGWAGWGAAKITAAKPCSRDPDSMDGRSQPAVNQSQPKAVNHLRRAPEDFEGLSQTQCPQAKISTLAPIFTDFTTVLFGHPMELEADAPVFLESSPSGQAPWSSDGNSEQLQATSIKIDSHRQDFSMPCLDSNRSEEVFQKYEQA